MGGLRSPENWGKITCDKLAFMPMSLKCHQNRGMHRLS